MAYDGHETPGFDFDTDPARLPTGAIQIDTIQIQFKSVAGGTTCTGSGLGSNSSRL